MDKTLLKILELLEPGGLGSPNNIKPIINKSFKMFDDKTYFDIQRTAILDFLYSIENEVKFFKPIDSQISVFDEKNKPIQWVSSEMRVSLMQNGIYSLNRERDRQLTIATNKSVIETSSKQANTNEKIAANAKSQTDILKSQRYILWASVFVAVCSVFISYLSYRKDVPNNRLQQELKTTNQRLDSIRKELSQIMKKGLPVITATKNATKTTADSGSKRSDTPIKTN